jgi:hypothetical protein
MSSRPPPATSFHGQVSHDAPDGSAQDLDASAELEAAAVALAVAEAAAASLGVASLVPRGEGAETSLGGAEPRPQAAAEAAEPWRTAADHSGQRRQNSKRPAKASEVLLVARPPLTARLPGTAISVASHFSRE